MKFRTFRNVIAMVLFLSLGGTCYGCFAWWQRSLLVEEADVCTRAPRASTHMQARTCTALRA